MLVGSVAARTVLLLSSLMMSGILLLMLLLLLLVLEGLRHGCSVVAFSLYFSFFSFYKGWFCVLLYCLFCLWRLKSVDVVVYRRGSSVAVAVAVRGLAISTLYFRNS